MSSVLKATLMAAMLALPLSGTASVAATNQVQTEADRQLQNWSRFMSPADLWPQLAAENGVQIIDIRAQKYFKRGIIPGAVSIPFSDWRGPKERPGQPPNAADLEALLGAAGIDLQKPIVIYNHSGKTISTGRAAIVYWILKSAGAEHLAVLNGGLKGWDSAGLPVSDRHITPAATTVEVTYRYDWWADPFDILAISTKAKKGAILDARLDAQVKKSVETGKPMMSIPLARYTPASFFFNQLSAKKTGAEGQQEFREELVARGIQPDEGLLISVCQTGELSAISWFYASEIVGIENVRYYPDALQGWKSDGGIMFGLKVPGL